MGRPTFRPQADSLAEDAQDLPGASLPSSMDALLQPRSIALVGASDRAETLGRAMVDMARVGGYAGSVYAVNPKYEKIGEIPCFPSLSALPEPVDHVVFGIGNERIESTLDEAIAMGAQAATIFATCAMQGDGGAFRDKIAAKARGAGMAICGSNCMGFYNNAVGLRVAGYPALQAMPAGPIGWLAQSGSVFGALAHNDTRLKFHVAISSGAEMVTTSADYLAWMAQQEEIKVVGMFLEAVRDAEGFVASLELAANRDVPVVALKVGRTQASAQMALSHTGAITGNDMAYSALFKRYGVIQVDDEDELAAALLLLGQPRRPARGGLVAIHDSGGERELVADIADSLGVAYAPLEDATRQKLAGIIDPELEPTNPLDAWGSAKNFRTTFAEGFKALLEDDNAAVGMMFCDIRDRFYVSEGYADAAIAAHRATTKPVALATNYSMVRHDELVVRLSAAGVPVIDGSRVALKAVRHMLAWRDRPRPHWPVRPENCGSEAIADAWRRRLCTGAPLSEDEALGLLSDYGIATPRRSTVGCETDLSQVASGMRFPVVLKTAVPGILHKSDVGGVALGLADEAALSLAYADMRARLGAEAVVAEMASKGVELALGAVIDPQWGPMVVVSAGGTLMELLDDKAVALAPVSREEASELVGSLRIARLLDGYRGSAAADGQAVVDAVLRLGWLVSDLADAVAEFDVNPLIADAEGCVAVDALVIARPVGANGIVA